MTLAPLQSQREPPWVQATSAIREGRGPGHLAGRVEPSGLLARYDPIRRPVNCTPIRSGSPNTDPSTVDVSIEAGVLLKQVTKHLPHPSGAPPLHPSGGLARCSLVPVSHSLTGPWHAGGGAFTLSVHVQGSGAGGFGKGAQRARTDEGGTLDIGDAFLVRKHIGQFGGEEGRDGAGMVTHHVLPRPRATWHQSKR